MVSFAPPDAPVADALPHAAAPLATTAINANIATPRRRNRISDPFVRPVSAPGVARTRHLVRQA
jgi:hypothetical protein